MAERDQIECGQRCEVPEGVRLHPVPPPRHAWSDVVRCPNDGCGRCFLVTSPGVEGRSDPTGGDGYVPGAWDEVRSAYLDGNISAAAYDALRALVFPPEKE